jgi:hypothetical protein
VWPKFVIFEGLMHGLPLAVIKKMKEYIYKDKEIGLVLHLLNNQPKKIWWDFVSYAFDYGNYHLSLDCVDKQADTQNKFDEAIIAELSKVDKPFEPTEHTKLVCENKNIDNIYIVRTFLYFSTFQNYSEPKKLVNRVRYKLKSILKGKNDPIDDLISQSTGGGEEIICHPKSEEVNKINPDYSNLLDVGLLLEIEGKCLKSFLETNGFGFHIWEDKYFYEPKELEEDTQLYEFIKIENTKTLANS